MLQRETFPFHGAKLAILVEDAILLIQRDDIPSIPWPGYWDLPGGAREGSESPKDCVLRETQEELGLDIAAKCLTWGGCWPAPPSHIWLFVTEFSEFDVSSVRFGDEGQRFALAPIPWYLTRARAIPSQKRRLSSYLTYRDRIRRAVLPS